MKEFIPIDKRVINLNDSQAFIYLLIAYWDWKNRQEAKANNTVKKKTILPRNYFAKCLGVTDIYVSELLTAIENAGLIKRVHHFNNAVKDGYINQKIEFVLCYENWYKLNPFFINSKVDPKLKGFALRYRCLAYDDSIVVEYSKTECAEQMHISRPTFRKYYNALLETNLMNEYFPSVQTKDSKENYLSESSMDYLKGIQESIKQIKKDNTDKWIEFQQTKLYKEYKWVVQNRIWTRKNGDDIINKMMSGTLDIKTNKVRTKKQQYSF